MYFTIFSSKKRERAHQIADLLEKIFPSPKVPLHYTSAYTLLIATLLSAQCRDERVNQITPQLFAKASTPSSMASLEEEMIEQIIHSCGLGHSKAKAIRKLSKELVEKFGGEVPQTLQELESLTGVGHKTASVVLSQAFHQPAFPVDTHIHRCAKRWGLSSGKSREQTEKDLKALFPKNIWGKIHLQMILFARTFCPARGHEKNRCPICSLLPK